MPQAVQLTAGKKRHRKANPYSHLAVPVQKSYFVKFRVELSFRGTGRIGSHSFIRRVRENLAQFTPDMALIDEGCFARSERFTRPQDLRASSSVNRGVDRANCVRP
jgi:hypothetical protein